MKRRDLVQQAYERLAAFEFDAVPEDGRGAANDFRVRKAVENIGKWLELNPAPKKVKPPSDITGPVPGGWLIIAAVILIWIPTRRRKHQ